jgi:hypothetical protein
VRFGSESDLAGALDVLEHIDDDATALYEARRVLRPGGGIIITVPQHQWLWSDADDYAHHQRRYSRPELITSIETAGFRVQMVTSFVTLPLPATVFLESPDGCKGGLRAISIPGYCFECRGI